MFDIKPVTSAKPMDCGATCMKMLLSYYDQDVPLEDLTRECKTRIIGCSAGDLERVGIAHGLDIKVFEMDAEETIIQDRPSIIWWKYDHWCICCGMDDEGNVVIINPDRGRYRMKANTFGSFYTGVALFNGWPEDLPSD